MKEFIKKVGFPRFIITVFLIALIVLAVYLNIPLSGLLTDMLVRFGMNAILVLAMIPGIQSGIGLNFNLPLGIIFGLIGALISIEFKLSGFLGLFLSILIAAPLAAIAGYFYGKMLNRIKGEEMTVGNYIGFSVVSGMCIFWLIAPFSSPELIWAYGGNGLRVTVSLESSIAHVLNNFLAFNIGNVTIPTGLLLCFALFAFIVWIYGRSNKGLSMIVAGSNPNFAMSNGIDVDKQRIKGTVISTVLAAIGIIIYSQAFGFLQLYNAPLYSAMPAAAAILIGGATLKKANIVHVIVGTLLFQSLLVVALPVVNVIAEGSMSEVIRTIVSNGIILYALTREEGETA
ncbi:simple sugar transport system permease protein [Keratinibaculum paraultunense]|uniref:Simple sugar transport system permease protein n=1 Tax=Keratinibaculum paraultunense TaxID=1278232 RepID=A0A4R3KZJ7_9FIRM|nr:ABC transporter permease [Keratinibaculum paraultunense]QQY80315.1 ABC transporter permease [Keratinibaculum paraultunense]TCS90837.1 simple sugar transport system permease protein [Keratinibaculum paraultunense]